jgi:hypothetical protein
VIQLDGCGLQVTFCISCRLKPPHSLMITGLECSPARKWNGVELIFVSIRKAGNFGFSQRSMPGVAPCGRDRLQLTKLSYDYLVADIGKNRPTLIIDGLVDIEAEATSLMRS